MKLRVLAPVLITAALALPAQAQTEIQWWHSMTGGLNDWVLDLAKGFNESQKAYKVVPTYKGTYDESMTASIAAFRAGNAPHRYTPRRAPAAAGHAERGIIPGVHGAVSGQPGFCNPAPKVVC